MAAGKICQGNGWTAALSAPAAAAGRTKARHASSPRIKAFLPIKVSACLRTGGVTKRGAPGRRVPAHRSIEQRQRFPANHSGVGPFDMNVSVDCTRGSHALMTEALLIILSSLMIQYVPKRNGGSGGGRNFSTQRKS